MALTDDDDAYLKYSKTQRQYAIEGLHTFGFGRYADMRVYETQLNSLSDDQLNAIHVMYVKQLFVTDDKSSTQRADVLLPIIRLHIKQALKYLDDSTEIDDALTDWQLLMKVPVDSALKSAQFIRSLGSISSKIIDIYRLAILGACIEYKHGDKQINTIDDVIIRGVPQSIEDCRLLPKDIRGKLEVGVSGAESWWNLSTPNQVDKRVLLSAWLNGRDNSTFILEEPIVELLKICRYSDVEIKKKSLDNVDMSLPPWPAWQPIKLRITTLLKAVEYTYLKSHNLKLPRQFGGIVTGTGRGSSKLTGRWSKSDIHKLTHALIQHGIPDSEGIWSVDVPACPFPDSNNVTDLATSPTSKPSITTNTIHLENDWNIFVEQTQIRTKTIDQIKSAAGAFMNHASQVLALDEKTGMQSSVSNINNNSHSLSVVDMREINDTDHHATSDVSKYLVDMYVAIYMYVVIMYILTRSTAMNVQD